MVDLFQKQGNTPETTPPRNQRGPTLSDQNDSIGEDQGNNIGGHSLRRTIRTPHDVGRRKPRSVLAFPRTQAQTADAQSTLEQEGFIQFAGPHGQTYFETSSSRLTQDRQSGHIEQTYDGGDDDDDDTYSSEDEIEIVQTTVPPTKTQGGINPQPFQEANINILPTSALGQAAARAQLFPGANLTTTEDLAWQASVAGEKQKAKEFWAHAIERSTLTVFAFLRPGSAYIQLLHAVGTCPDGEEGDEVRNKVFGFVGDQRDVFPQPTPVCIDEKAWTWTACKLVADITLLEEFYTVPANKTRLYHQKPKGGEQRLTVPRLLFLPPILVAFCAETPRTPMELHSFVTALATRDNTDTLNEWELVLAWCFVAAHHDASSPSTSMVALTFHNAPTHDDRFVEWLQVLLQKSFAPSGTNSPGSQQENGNSNTFPPPQPVTQAQQQQQAPRPQVQWAPGLHTIATWTCAPHTLAYGTTIHTDKATLRHTNAGIPKRISADPPHQPPADTGAPTAPRRHVGPHCSKSNTRNRVYGSGNRSATHDSRIIGPIHVV
jgi:hypothetical protein